MRISNPWNPWNPLQWSLQITDTLGTLILSVVERCPLFGDCLTIITCLANSIRATRFVRCRGLSASRSVRFGRLHCIPQYSKFLNGTSTPELLLFLQFNKFHGFLWWIQIHPKSMDYGFDGFQIQKIHNP